MGNAVGPVALIAAGIYLGYLTLTGKASAFVALLKGNSVTTTSSSTTSSSTQNGTTDSGTSTLSSVTNPFGIMNATPHQVLINSQIPLTIDSGSLVGTSGG